jgi:hypothetical protein
VLSRESRGGKKPKKKPERERRRKSPSFGRILRLLRADGVVSGFFRLVGRMVRRIHVRELDGVLRVGLDDPADTGMLYSSLWPLLIPLNLPGLDRMQLALGFEGRVLRFVGRGDVRIVPIEMLPPLLAFIFSPAGFRAFWIMVLKR